MVFTEIMGWYDFLDWLEDRGIPIYKLVDWLEDRGIPSPVFFGGIAVILILLVVLFFVGRVPSVSVKVTSLQGVPLQGVSVSSNFSPDVVLTNAKGISKLSFKGLGKDGYVIVKAEKTGYLAKEKIWQRNLGKLLSFSLPKLVPRQVYIKDAQGNPINGATVTVRCSNNPEFEDTYSNASSTLEVLVPEDCGTLSLSISKTGYSSFSGSLPADGVVRLTRYQGAVHASTSEDDPVNNANFIARFFDVITQETITNNLTVSLYDPTNSYILVGPELIYNGVWNKIVSKGSYWLHVSDNNGEYNTLAATVSLLQDKDMNFYLNPITAEQEDTGGKLTIIVKESSSPYDKIEGASIYILNNENEDEEYVGITDDEGEFVVFLSEGTYNITVSKAGYAPQIRQINMEDDDDTETFRLESCETTGRCSLARVYVEDVYGNSINNNDLPVWLEGATQFGASLIKAEYSPDGYYHANILSNIPYIATTYVSLQGFCSRQSYGFSSSEETASEGETIDFTIVTELEEGHLTGVIKTLDLLEEEVGYGGAVVTVTQNTEQFQTISGTDGSFEIDVPSCSFLSVNIDPQDDVFSQISLEAHVYPGEEKDLGSFVFYKCTENSANLAKFTKFNEQEQRSPENLVADSVYDATFRVCSLEEGEIAFKLTQELGLIEPFILDSDIDFSPVWTGSETEFIQYKDVKEGVNYLHFYFIVDELAYNGYSATLDLNILPEEQLLSQVFTVGAGVELQCYDYIYDPNLYGSGAYWYNIEKGDVEYTQNTCVDEKTLRRPICDGYYDTHEISFIEEECPQEHICYMGTCTPKATQAELEYDCTEVVGLRGTFIGKPGKNCKALIEGQQYKLNSNILLTLKEQQPATSEFIFEVKDLDSGRIINNEFKVVKDSGPKFIDNEKPFLGKISIASFFTEAGSPLPIPGGLEELSSVDFYVDLTNEDSKTLTFYDSLQRVEFPYYVLVNDGNSKRFIEIGNFRKRTKEICSEIINPGPVEISAITYSVTPVGTTTQVLPQEYVFPVGGGMT